MARYNRLASMSRPLHHAPAASPSSPRRAARSRWLAWLVLSAVGCAHQFPAQYDREALRVDSARWPGEALVHYLSRADADASVCERETFARVDASLVEPFVASLETSRVPHQRWGACAQRLLAWLPEELREAFVEGLAQRVTGFVERSEAAPLEVIRDALERRPRGPSRALGALRAKLERASPTSPAVREATASIRALVELEEGRLRGQPLTEALVLSLEDEALLRRIEARAPGEAVRLAARRRVVRLHVAQSTMKEVKERAAEVEAAVIAHGRWVQRVASLPAPAPQPPLVAPAEVRFSQDIGGQLVHPFIVEGERRRAPALALRPLLRFHVGWSEPLPLCDEPAALAVTPCIDPAEVRLGSGFAKLDEAGVLHLLPKWAMADAIELTRAGVGLVVPVKLGDRLAQLLQVPLAAEGPRAFCFEGDPTARGPLVNAVVVPVAHGLLVEAISESGRRVHFVIPRRTLGVEFGSCGGRGLPGAAGTPGAAGSSGTSGTNAMCPSSPGGRGGNGQNGGAGGPGGRGGPGGDGGAVRVELVCGKDCEDEALVRSVFRSRGGLGGDGGPGGLGGRGGSGGAGGSGTSCYANGKTTFVSGGSAGSHGAQGPSGAPGPRGAPGLDGAVQVLLR